MIAIINASCVAAVSTEKTEPMTNADSMSSDYKGNSESAKSDLTTKRFGVIYTVDYGYAVAPEHDPTALMPVAFADRELARQFDDFFSSENMSKIVGKRVLCDCSGETVVRNGKRLYLLERGRIFAEP